MNQPRGAADEQPTGQSTIMIVDDTPDNLRLLLAVLRGKGHRVVAFPSGPQALAAAAANPPDLILLDVSMPDMNGFEVCQRLKADPALRDIPVLFLSALAEPEDKIRGFAVGGADYVTKPFQADEVQARVETHLQNRALQQRLQQHNEELERVVAERTRELAHSHQRLQELNRLKDDFLRMITHELRTPANGVLSMGQVLAELCPPSEESTRYAELFERSSARLMDLIEDATLLADADHLTRDGQAQISCSQLLDAVQASLPEILLDWTPATQREDAVLLCGEPALLQQALRSAVRLAALFGRDQRRVVLRGVVEGERLRLQFALDHLRLAPEQAADFFRIESAVRSESSAERLGLAPVVASQIVTAFGGELHLVKKDADTGTIEVLLPTALAAQATKATPGSNPSSESPLD